ncbi:DUF6516 family protein [Paenibacillus sp. P96]|uniref:DUF6516 family protein n=1 Tax=Paenibacillus zeirhizosphaerae TaxID=2987519 RepID=A0ABT9FLP8_9BACL|nr:DUF6516 family protein [Paenibacillus sp. P96]MDP4095640.1 DUF6516 family protein [Paenibacillus sp. P96]
MSLEIRRSNFLFIEQNFSDIIQEVREGADGLHSDGRAVRKTIIFHDFSKMYCVEMLDKDKQYIELYWYDWYNENKQLIMKFHAHYHPDGTPASITKFDPYHLHSSTDTRHHNEKFRELNDILEFIRVRQLSLKK